MTRLDSLRALYDAVKAGERGMGWNTAASFGDTQTAMDVVDAIDGSVDAALAFIAATLPNVGWTLVDDGRARLWRKGDDRSHPSILVDWKEADNPATALLLAGLAALIAEEETK